MTPATGGTTSPQSAAAIRDSAHIVGHTLARFSGWFGFVTGAFSRPHRNLEVWQFRRSIPDADPSLRCALCGARGDALRRLTPLGTSPDLAALGEYRVVLCTSCAVARTVPLPQRRALVIAPDVAAPRFGALQRALLARFIRQRVARVRPLLPGDRRPVVIDVGGGACTFANALAATGCDVTVFEPNGANAGAAGPGVRFVASPFEDSSVVAAAIEDGSCDAITMLHSLEHVVDPNATLALARRLLRPGGVVYVCVPNLDSLQADLAAESWCYLDVPHHVTHFSPEGLAASFQRAGFSAITPHWWNEEYEIFGFYQSILNAVTGSHNYFYNHAKKGRDADPGPRPLWTRAATACGPLLLPFAMVYAWWAAAAVKPSCVEQHASVPG